MKGDRRRSNEELLPNSAAIQGILAVSDTLTYKQVILVFEICLFRKNDNVKCGRCCTVSVVVGCRLTIFHTYFNWRIFCQNDSWILMLKLQ